MRTARARVAFAGLALVSLGFAACRGEVTRVPGSGGGDAGTAGPPAPAAWMPGATAGDPAAAPLMPLRRLNRTEYNNVVRDLLGDTSRPADSFSVPIAGSSGFATSGVIGEVDLAGYQQAAERLAAGADLGELSGCDPAAAGERACAEQLVRTFGRRAFRRPLSSGEVDDYLRLYTDELRGALGLGHDGAARGVLEAMLQDAPFLYHWELGPAAPRAVSGVIALSPFELASRLSFFLWSSTPDDRLLAAAEDGSLAGVATLEQEARRLLADAKAADTMRSFHLQWLEVSLKGAAKSPDLYPEFTPALAQDMEDELVELARSVVVDPGAGLVELLTGNRGFTSAALAPLYGVTAPGAALASVTLDAVRRPGILTRAGFLTMTSNAYEGDPTKRGSVIRRRVLCQPLPPPPGNVPPLPPSAPDATVRERHEAHITVAACNACHRFTDLIGFGFGNYDAVGRFKDSEAGKPVVASGTVVSLDGRDRDFGSPAELMQLLAASPQVQACLERQWLRFAFDRLETAADDYTLNRVYERFRASKLNVTELLVAIATSRSFMFRAPSAGEVTR